MNKMPDTLAAAAFHAALVVRCCLQGDVMAWDKLVLQTVRKVIGVYSVYYVSDVVKPKVSLLVAGISRPLILVRESIVVLLFSRFLKAVVAFIQSKEELSESLPVSIFKLTSSSWQAILGPSLRLSYFAFRAFHAVCPFSVSFLAARPQTSLLRCWWSQMWE